MFEIYVREKFDAAHYLPNHPGKCSNMHGHSWQIEVTVKSKNLKDGMILDFDKVKKVLKEIVHDHCLLNDIIPNPTAENLAQYYYEKIKQKISGLTKVTVWESTSSGAAYFEN